MRPVAVAAVLSLILSGSAFAQVTLEAKRAEEATTVTRSTSKIHQILNIAGMDVQTDVDVEETTRSTSGKRQPDGTLRVEQKTEAIKFKLAVPGAMVDFDSAKPEEGKSDNPMLQAIVDGLRARVGTAYTLVWGKDNKIAAVEGTDKALAKLPPGAVDSFKSDLDPERIKRTTNEQLALLPDKPVNKGDRWERTHRMDVGGGQTLVFTSFFTYDGTVEKDGKMLDKITVFHSAVKYELAEDAPIPLKVVSSDLKVTNSTGMMLFDRERGQVVEDTSSTRIEGPMTFSVNGMELPGKLDLTIDSTAVVGK